VIACVEGTVPSATIESTVSLIAKFWFWSSACEPTPLLKLSELLLPELLLKELLWELLNSRSSLLDDMSELFALLLLELLLPPRDRWCREVMIASLFVIL